MKSPFNLCHLLCGLALAGWTVASAQQNPPALATPPPSAPPKRSAADLERLVASIALYPDPLLATMLPASVYPLEIVQAARFVADPNNLAKLNEQPWDENVKAVARVPEAIKKLNDDLAWTIALGEAFLAQDKDLMDAIQALRAKARTTGTLQTTPQQVVTVTNVVVEKRVEQQVVVVTNTIVQIQPSSSSVVYVPSYNPYIVYYPLPPTYVGPPPIVSFAAGVAVGAIIANNCDWYHGGCYHGNVDIDIDRTVNRNSNVNRSANVNPGPGPRTATTSAQQKWQPDQSRLSKSGSPAASSVRGTEARGWSSAPGTPGAPPAIGGAGARPTSTWTPPANRATPASAASRPSPAPGVSSARSSVPANRPTPSGSAFGGTSSGAGVRDYSNRGATSRSSGGFSGGGGRGGGRGGGGRR